MTGSRRKSNERHGDRGRLLEKMGLYRPGPYKYKVMGGKELADFSAGELHLPIRNIFCFTY